MIVPTKRLRELNEIGYKDRQRDLCELLQLDPAIWSRVINRERGASAKIVQKVCQNLNLRFEDAWEFTDGEEEDA